MILFSLSHGRNRSSLGQSPRTTTLTVSRGKTVPPFIDRLWRSVELQEPLNYTMKNLKVKWSCLTTFWHSAIMSAS